MAGTPFIKAEDVLKATNDGLDIILELYPDAFLSVQNKNRKFKIRDDEKSASASLSPPGQTSKGYRDAWVVTDFGDDSKPLNGIMCYAKYHGIDFVESLRQLGAKYNITGEDFKPDTAEAVKFVRDATPDEADGEWLFETAKSFTDQQIETLVPKYALYKIGWKQGEERHKDAYTLIATKAFTLRFYPVISYTVIKNRKAYTFSSTEDYPIFLWDEKTADKKNDFKKLYQPKSQDKGRRFMYHGKKEKDFIHGYEQAEKEYKLNLQANEQQNVEEIDSAAITGSLDDLPKEDNSKWKDPKLKEIVLCSGGSDALTMLYSVIK